MNELQQLILHNGLSDQYNLIKTTNTVNKLGCIAVYESKPKMAQSQGTIIHDFNDLMDQQASTHFTPNIFAWAAYNKGKVAGLTEKNLNQINCFVVDIDMGLDKLRAQEVIEKAFKTTLAPTAIIESEHGYQAFFVLEQPCFISRANNYKSLQTAKIISQKIRLLYAEEFDGVDLGCNNFGVFRMPTEKNTIFFEPMLQVNFKDLITFTKKIAQKNPPMQLVGSQKMDTVNNGPKQIKTDWYRDLVLLTNLEPGQGLARNNAMLTIALANYQSNQSKEQAYNVIDEFNTNLSNPINNSEVKRIVASAYSGRYHGASVSYAKSLISAWGTNTKSYQATTITWYKFKRSRNKRQYSHFSEWERDVLSLLYTNVNERGFLTLTQNQICESLKIARSSLQTVLKRLVKKHVITYRASKGRNATTHFAIISIIIKSVIGNKNKQRKAYKETILSFVNDLNEMELRLLLPAAKYIENKLMRAVSPPKITQEVMKIETG